VSKSANASRAFKSIQFGWWNGSIAIDRA
jgi:hypothetical protein